jgi:hypothetical protein
VLPENEYDLEGKTAIIYNMQGKLLLKYKFQSQKGQINMSSLLPGVYYLQVGDGADRKMQRIVKI